MNIQATVRDKVVLEVFVEGKPAYRSDAECCRQVFETDNLYIKFDNPRYPDREMALQTMDELEVLSLIQEEDKKYFCLPVAWGIIDGLCYTVQEEVIDELYPTAEDVQELRNVLNKYGLGCDVGHSEWGNHNCAFTKEGWKIYDYALRNEDEEFYIHPDQLPLF